MTNNAARILAAGTLACAMTAALAAQGDKIQIRLVPPPDQWVEFHLTLDMTMQSPKPPGGSGPAIPSGSAHTTMTYTQTTGHPDADGRVKAEVTFEDFSGTATTGDKTIPITMPDVLAERPFTAVYDSQGKLLDIDFPSNLPAATVAQVRQMMTAFFNGRVPQAVGIGETVATPLTMQLPGAGGQAADLNGTNWLTLRAVETRGGERLAHFDQKVESSIVRALPLPAREGAAADAVTLTVHTLGTGTMDYNVDRGFVVANALTTTIDTKIAGDKPLPKGMPAIGLHMTMKMALDAVY